MLVPRRLMLGLAVCLVLWLGLTTAAPARQNSCLPPRDVQDANSGSAQVPLPGPAQDMSSSKQTESPFGCLMDAVSPEALHEVLHRYFPNRFKDGVYESDHSAMEAVHRADPPLATSLVRIARRQTPGNGTTTAPPPPPPTTTSTPATSLPRSTPNPDTTPSLSTSTTTRPQTSNPDAETTPAPTRTTSSTARSQKPQVTTYTSTASNGAVTVVTATTYVPAEPADTTDGTKAGGSLQTNAAVPWPRGVGVEALAGVVIGGLFLV